MPKPCKYLRFLPYRFAFVSSARQGKANLIKLMSHFMRCIHFHMKEHNNDYALLFNDFSILTRGRVANVLVRRETSTIENRIWNYYLSPASRREIMRSLVICLCVFTLSLSLCFITLTHSLRLSLSLVSIYFLFLSWNSSLRVSILLASLCLHLVLLFITYSTR